MTRNEFRFRVLAELECIKSERDSFGYIINTDEEGDLYGVQFTENGVVTKAGIRFYEDTYQFYGAGFSTDRWYSSVNSIMNATSIAGEYLIRINHLLGTNTTMFF